MGDWFHVHHLALCRDHATALRLYERIEIAADAIERGDAGPSGMLFGLFEPRAILLTTTNKWGAFPSFGRALVDGLPAQLFTLDESSDDDAGPHAFATEVRAALGGGRAFLWSDQEEVRRALLSTLSPLAFGPTTLAIAPSGAAASRAVAGAAGVLAGRDYSFIVEGFVTPTGRCFVTRRHFGGADGAHDTPLPTPLAARRQRGSGSWAISNELDGNELLPVGGDAIEVWMLERHDPRGAWQPRAQRLATADAALRSDDPQERQAGCALARRWWLPELRPLVARACTDPDPYVRASAELAASTLVATEVATANASTVADPAELRARCDDPTLTVQERTMAWLGLAEVGGDEDVVRSLALLSDPGLRDAARWVAASRGDLSSPGLVQRIVDATVDLAELVPSFMQRAWVDPSRAPALVSYLGELAYATTRSSYWMCRYGAPGRDAPTSELRIDGHRYRGEPGASAARVVFWATRTVWAAAHGHGPRELLQAFVAFDAMLAACRDNRAWWIPSLGTLHARIELCIAGHDGRAIDGTDAPDLVAFAQLKRDCQALLVEFRALAADDGAPDRPARVAAFERASIAALAGCPAPATMVSHAQYVRLGAPALISTIANNLAWSMHLRGAHADALPYADLAVGCAHFDDDAARDTRARILLALGREPEARAVVRAALGRNPDGDAFAELALRFA